MNTHAELIETLQYILELAQENMRGLDGYEMIAEWARNAIDA